MDTRQGPNLMGTAKLVSLFVIPALILITIVASAGATQPTAVRPTFATIQLPDSAKSIPISPSLSQRSVRNPKLDTSMAKLADAAKTTAAQALDLAQQESLRLS